VPGASLATHADDLSRLLAAHTAEPALVYGSSLGALIALELTVRRPGQVGVVVAHEPPVTQVLPEPERGAALADLRGAEEVFRTEGVIPALRRFAEFVGIDPSDREPEAGVRAQGPRQLANAAFLLAYDVPAIRGHTLDLAALKGSPARVVPAAGENSGHVWPHRCARLLAEELGTACAVFPGGHNGYVFRPRATAERLDRVLGARLNPAPPADR
jgi:pimeloyl-ACP methyl ester carboxylesterase